MPILPTVRIMNLAGLSVSYRGSDQSQLVDVRVEIESKAHVASARLGLRYLLDAINLGAAGGAAFAPTTGAARLVKGSFSISEPDARGPKFAWTLELAGVSPKFIRVLVESLSGAGGGRIPVQRLTIAGTLAPAVDDPLTMREDALIRAFDDPDAYPEAWPDPGFPISHKSIARGATATLQLGSEPTPEILEKLTYVLTLSGTTATTFPNAAKNGISIITPMPTVKANKLEVTARWGTFDVNPTPMVAGLTNMLARFHRDVTPIVQVAYAYPGAGRS